MSKSDVALSNTPSVNVKYMKTNVYTHGHAVVPAASIIFRNKLDKLSASRLYYSLSPLEEYIERKAQSVFMLVFWQNHNHI
jgi:hypothetical protein